MGSVYICHSIVLFMGYYSLLHPLKTVFSWSAGLAYCASKLYKQLPLFDYTFSALFHSYYIPFLLLCIILSMVKLRCSRMFEKSTLYRLGKNFRARRFYHLLLFVTITSFIVSAGVNGELSNQDLVSLGMVLIFSDWESIPILIKVCLTAPTSGYKHFDRENYLKLHNDEARVFFSTMDNVVLDHFMRLLVLNICGILFPAQFGLFCDRLKTHLIIAFLAFFTLLPVLTRINFSSGRHISGFFNLRLSWFIVKESNRPRREFDASPSKSASSAFKPVYSSLRHTVHLLISVGLVFINILCECYALLRAYFLADLEFGNGGRKCTLASLWILFGSSFIALTFWYKLKHFLSQECSCEFCAKPMPRRIRRHTESEISELAPSYITSSSTQSMKENLDSADANHKEDQQLIEVGDKDALSIVPKSPKPSCTVKSRADEAAVVSSKCDF